jgi:hypothetical protein
MASYIWFSRQLKVHENNASKKERERDALNRNVYIGNK